jgi:hypothetical protein
MATETREIAISGWTRYVYAVTREMPATAPVEDRFAVLAGEDLPQWLEEGIWRQLVAGRGQALVEQVTVRAGTSG